MDYFNFITLFIGLECKRSFAPVSVIFILEVLIKLVFPGVRRNRGTLTLVAPPGGRRPVFAGKKVRLKSKPYFKQRKNLVT